MTIPVIILSCCLAFLLGCGLGLLEPYYERKFTEYASSKLGTIYFCGHNFADVIEKRFFPRYCDFTDYGFCWTVAALGMLAMKDNRSSRIVHATFDNDGQELFHGWLEFRFLGIWWIFDPLWGDPASFIRPHRGSYPCLYPIKTKQICNHDKFWSYPISRQLQEKLKHPETSYLFHEVYRIYTNYRDVDTMFCDQLLEFTLPTYSGKCCSPGTYIDDADGAIIFSRRILDEFMAKPTRLRPKSHTIRTVLATKKKYKQRWEEYKAEHGLQDDIPM